MAKILVLSFASPIPVIDGAAIVVFQKLALLSSLGHDVDCAYIESKEVQRKARVEDLSKYCRNVFRFPFSAKTGYINTLKGLFTNTLPMQVNYFYLRTIQKWVDDNICNYDFVWCMEIRMAEYVKKYKEKVIFDYVDCISAGYKKGAENKKGLWRLIYKIDSKRCSVYEKYLSSIFKKRVFITAHDRDCAFPEKDVPCFILPNYVKIDPKKMIDQDKTDGSIVFVGSMFYDPNVIAVKYFVKNVFPIILKSVPQTKFYIVGNRPTDEVKALQTDNVIVTGFVEDVWKYLEKASVVVVPMRTGSGLQNKILEGLSVGGCVVASDICTQGLIQEEGMPFVSNNDNTMAKQIVDLLKDKDLRKSVSKQSFDYVCRNYSYEVVRAKIKEIIES